MADDGWFTGRIIRDELVEGIFDREYDEERSTATESVYKPVTLRQAINHRKSMVFSGRQRVGKSTLARMVASRCGRPRCQP